MNKKKKLALIEELRELAIDKKEGSRLNELESLW